MRAAAIHGYGCNDVMDISTLVEQMPKMTHLL